MASTLRLGLIVAALALLRAPSVGEETPPRRAEWMRQAGFGVFMHYLAGKPDLPVKEWNRLIDGFDVEGLATQLASVKARYFFITLGQNSGHYLSPNRAYDEFTGIHPSKCSTCDLVADLSAALSQRGIRLMVYLPAGAPDRDQVAMRKLEWRNGPQRNAEFQKKWERVIGEWSTRWGQRVSGWWFDGCYWPNAMYRSPKPPNYTSFAAAARKGNPDSLVAFNRGVVYPIHPESGQEDYTAGELDNPELIRMNGGFWEDRSQFHVLTYLGKWWCGAPARFSDADVVRYTRMTLTRNGAITWDIPREANGLIPEPFLRQLRLAGEEAVSRRR
jgi:hypothetical protein